MIEFKNIDLKFSNLHIFQDLNFKIKKNEHVCFSGASGRGKSTLLKMLQGYIIPDKGKIRINNLELSDRTVDRIRDTLVWIPQNINLPVNNGKALLELMELEHKWETVVSIGKKLLLEEKILSKDFTKISGGQKQRVITAICLSIEKDIILMDEPTAALDAEAIDALLKTLSALPNRTILSASHNEKWLREAGRVISL